MSALGDFARTTLDKYIDNVIHNPWDGYASEERVVLSMYTAYRDEYRAKAPKKWLNQENFLDGFVTFYGIIGCKKYSKPLGAGFSSYLKKNFLRCAAIPAVITATLMSLLSAGLLSAPVLMALAPLAGKINATKIKPKIEKYTEDLFIKDLESGVLIDRYINDLPSLAPVFALLGPLESVTSLKEKFIIAAQRQEQENAEKILKEGVIPEGRIRIKLKNGGP